MVFEIRARRLETSAPDAQGRHPANRGNRVEGSLGAIGT
jgi:hypothetical protein